MNQKTIGVVAVTTLLLGCGAGYIYFVSPALSQQDKLRVERGGKQNEEATLKRDVEALDIKLKTLAIGSIAYFDLSRMASNPLQQRREMEAKTVETLASLSEIFSDNKVVVEVLEPGPETQGVNKPVPVPIPLASGASPAAATPPPAVPDGAPTPTPTEPPVQLTHKQFSYEIRGEYGDLVKALSEIQGLPKAISINTYKINLVEPIVGAPTPGPGAPLVSDSMLKVTFKMSITYVMDSSGVLPPAPHSFVPPGRSVTSDMLAWALKWGEERLAVAIGEFIVPPACAAERVEHQVPRVKSVFPTVAQPPARAAKFTLLGLRPGNRGFQVYTDRGTPRYRVIATGRRHIVIELANTAPGQALIGGTPVAQGGVIDLHAVASKTQPNTTLLTIETDGSVPLGLFLDPQKRLWLRSQEPPSSSTTVVSQVREALAPTKVSPTPRTAKVAARAVPVVSRTLKVAPRTAKVAARAVPVVSRTLKVAPRTVRVAPRPSFHSALPASFASPVTIDSKVSRLQNITFATDGLIVESTGAPLRFKVLGGNNHLLLLQIEDAVLPGQVQLFPVNMGGVKQVRAATYSTRHQQIRLAIDTDGSVRVTPEQLSGNRLRLALSPMSRLAKRLAIVRPLVLANAVDPGVGPAAASTGVVELASATTSVITTTTHEVQGLSGRPELSAASAKPRPVVAAASPRPRPRIMRQARSVPVAAARRVVRPKPDWPEAIAGHPTATPTPMALPHRGNAPATHRGTAPTKGALAAMPSPKASAKSAKTAAASPSPSPRPSPSVQPSPVPTPEPSPLRPSLQRSLTSTYRFPIERDKLTGRKNPFKPLSAPKGQFAQGIPGKAKPGEAGANGPKKPQLLFSLPGMPSLPLTRGEEGAAPPKVPGGAEMLGEGYTLKGIVEWSGQPASAVIEFDKKTYTVGLKGTLPGNAIVKSIKADHVVLSANGRDLRLEIKR